MISLKRSFCYTAKKAAPRRNKRNKLVYKKKDHSIPCTELPNEDALVILCKGKIPAQQFAELKSILKNPCTNDESLKQKFYTGKLRIGRSQNNLYWEECSKIFSETKIVNIQKEIKEYKLTIEAKRKEINNLENQKRKLNTELNHLTNQLNNYIESLEGLEMVTDSLQEITTKVSNIEKTLVKDMQTQLEIDTNQFSSLNEKSKFPKLSLIFNAMGLSSETICILQDYTGVKFNDDDLNDSTKYYGIHDFKEQKELFYIRHMMQKKLISTDHVENCAVCICKTPLDLKNLLLEREIDVPIDFSFVDDFQLNGPRFLFINYSDCTKRFVLDVEEAEQLMELKEQLHSLHLYDEIRCKPKNKVLTNNFSLKTADAYKPSPAEGNGGNDNRPPSSRSGWGDRPARSSWGDRPPFLSSWGDRPSSKSGWGRPPPSKRGWGI